MVPAPVERSELPGHRQRSPNSAAPTVGHSPALARRRGRCGSERSAEFGSVYRFRCPHARARGGRRFQRALTQTDLHRPAGRRCGCWPTSTVLFSGIVVGRFGGGRWRSGSAPMLTSASPGRGGGDGAGAGRAQRATGSSTTIAKFCSTDSGALSRACSAPRPLRLGKISGIWQRLPLSLPPRARARRAPIPARSDADRPAPAGGAALRLLADVDSSF